MEKEKEKEKECVCSYNLLTPVKNSCVAISAGVA